MLSPEERKARGGAKEKRKFLSCSKYQQLGCETERSLTVLLTAGWAVKYEKISSVSQVLRSQDIMKGKS